MRALIILIAGCMVLSISTFAQVRYRPTETGPWRPWSFTATPSTRTMRGATNAEVQAFQARLQELSAIVKRAPVVAPPIGFAAEMWGSLDSYDGTASGQPPGRAVPLAGRLTFGAFPLIEFQRGGRTVNEDLKGGETQLLQFVVNRIDGSIYGTSRPLGWGTAEVEAFVEPGTGAPAAGHPRIGDVFVIRKNPKPLWMPFALADALQPVVTDRRELFENRRDNYAKQLAEFAEWQTPATRAARGKDWQEAAASMPNGAGAEFLANMEKADVQIEAQSRATLAPGGVEERGVREAERDFREAEGVLAALSAEARSAPSCYDERATAVAMRFRSKEGAPSSCRPLVRPNWGYFDSTLPRSAPQILMIAAFTRCLTRESMTETTRGGCLINRGLVESIDWDAVRGWLDR